MFEEYLVVGRNNQEYLNSVPQITVGRLFWDRLANHNPNKIAEVYSTTGTTYNFWHLLKRSVRFSLWLRLNNCLPGDVVLVCFGNELAFTPLMLGCLWAGAILAPINPFFNLDDFQLLISNTKPGVIICSQIVLAQLKEASQNVGLSPNFVLIDNENNDEDITDINEIWETTYPGEHAFQPYDLAPDALKDHCIMILCSSGSTGLPKGVRHTDSSIMYGIHILTHMDDFFTSKDILLTSSAGYWVSGILFRFSEIYFGLTNVIMPNFTSEHFCKSVEKYKVTRTLMSPVLVGQLAKFNVKPYNLKSLRKVTFGGAAISDEVRQLAQKNLGVFFQCCYGMTEILVMMEPFNGQPGGLPTSVGRCVPGTQAKVISIDTGLTLPPNERGELCIRSPSIMQGYHNNKQATKETLDDQKWLHTGDVAYYNEEGWFFIIDRIKELIKYKGNHVAGSEIEAIVIQHPDVSEVCVVGIPHEIDWEHPKAFVVRTANAKATETDLVQFVKERMPDYKQLHGGVQFLEELPKTSTGKIKRLDLRKIHQAA